MKKTGPILAVRLREARGKLTQTCVANSLGISQAVLSKIESGLREPTAVELKNFAELYRKPIAFFFKPAEKPVEYALENFLKKNARLFNIEMAFLYGSFARGLPNEQSDVDIAVIFCSKNLSDEKVFDIVSDISLRLTRILKRDANVIAIRTGNWKPMLYYNVIVLGKLLFARNEAKYLSLRWEAIRQMEDFAEMGCYWQVAAARSNLRRLDHG